MDSAQPFGQFFREVAQQSIILLLVGIPLLYYIKKELREGLGRLTEHLGGVITRVFADAGRAIIPTIKEGFETGGNVMAVTFADTVDKRILPLIKTSLDDVNIHIKDAFSRLTPADTAKESPEVKANIQAFVDAGDYQGLVSKLESISDKSKRASHYKEFVKISLSKQDRFNSISAAHKIKEIEGDTPDGYWVLGYVYWWFGEIDTAITHTERALELTEELSDGRPNHMLLGKIYNALAYYYAEKGVNKDQAFSYIAECFKEPFVGVGGEAAALDTRGFVLLKFGNTEGEIDSAGTDESPLLIAEMTSGTSCGS